MGQVLIQIVADDQGEVSLEYLADLVRLLPPEEIVRLLTQFAAELDKDAQELQATLTDFALLTSAMHMAWMRTVTGRMKSDYMYSVGVVYNTFPLPPQGEKLAKLESLAQAVLNARATHTGVTLADLYNPNQMPPDLRKAHNDLDRAVDRLYRPGGFASERERVEHLFMLYKKMRAPLEAGAKKKRRRRGLR